MRAALDLLYKISGFLAGFFLVAIAVLIAGEIVGRELGLEVRSFDDFSGFCLAATSFLGLAYTFRANEHIRMTLLLHHLRGSARRAFELASLGVAAFLAGYFAWYSCEMTVVSWQIHDVSQGLIAVPLWIPQSGMALGLLVLFIAVVDDLVSALRGRPTACEAAEASAIGSQPTFER
ncbi:MAG: TRAP transporter small permease [Burkholderiales bacterium]|nr:TRAP transporter small permease [Burkholderiales bacterium]